MLCTLIPQNQKDITYMQCGSEWTGELAVPGIHQSRCAAIANITALLTALLTALCCA